MHRHEINRAAEFSIYRNKFVVAVVLNGKFFYKRLLSLGYVVLKSVQEHIQYWRFYKSKHHKGSFCCGH